MSDKNPVQLQKYARFRRRKRIFLLLLITATAALALFALNVGSLPLAVTDILRALLGGGDPVTRTSVLNIRFPRVAAALLVGASLASAGAVMQCVLHNPLASASTLGVSQGAAFGAAVAILFFGGGTVSSANTTTSVTVHHPGLVTFFAFFFGALSSLIIIAVSRYRRGIGPSGLILAGVAMSSLFSGGNTLLQYFADDTELGTIVFWTFGNLGSANGRELTLLAIVLAASLIYFYANRWNYNAIDGGTDVAESLGVNTRAVTFLSMGVASLLTATAVSFVGIISFIGLISPHIVRKFVGNDYRSLIGTSAWTGAMLLLLADTFGRSILAPVVLPIGALTSFLGAPMFLFLLFQGAKQNG